jgi:hypothetical protein
VTQRLRSELVQTDDFEYAVAQARQHYKAARNALIDDVRSRQPSATADEALQVAVRSFQLNASSVRYAERIWTREIPHEKAAAALRAQFHEFPETVVDRALYEATVETR